MQTNFADARSRCAALAAFAAAAVLCWQALNVHFNYGSNWTALFFHGSAFRLPPMLEDGTYVHPNTTGYDGQFYRMMAHDPWMRRGHARYLDDARLRYRRILLPGAAWVIGGQYADHTLIALIAAWCGLGVYWTGRFMERHQGKPVYGLAFLAMPASITSFERMLLDGALLALFMAFLLYLEEGRRPALWAVCATGALLRDSGVLLSAAAVGHFLWGREWKRAALFALALAPALSWWMYVAAHTPPSNAAGVFGWPLVGMVGRLFTLRTAPGALEQTVLRVLDVPAVLGLLAGTVLAPMYVWHLPQAGQRLCIMLFALMTALLTGGSHLQDAYGFGRPSSPLLLFLTFLALTRRLWWLGLPAMAVSAAVVIYAVRPAMGVISGILR